MYSLHKYERKSLNYNEKCKTGTGNNVLGMPKFPKNSKENTTRCICTWKSSNSGHSMFLNYINYRSQLFKRSKQEDLFVSDFVFFSSKRWPPFLLMNNGRGGDQLLLLLVRSSCHNQLLFAHLLLLSGKEAVELMGPEERHQHRLRGKVLTAGTTGSCGWGRLQQLLRLYRCSSRLLLHQRRWLLLGPTPILTVVVVVAVVRRGNCCGDGGGNIVSTSGVAAVAVVSPCRAVAAFLTKHFEWCKIAVGPADL